MLPKKSLKPRARRAVSPRVQECKWKSGRLVPPGVRVGGETVETWLREQLLSPKEEP